MGDLARTINGSNVAATIDRWMRGTYVTEDVRYDARHRREPGLLQKHRECMVAEGMPATAVAIVFVSDGDSITDVHHTMVFGCGGSAAIPA